MASMTLMAETEIPLGCVESVNSILEARVEN